MKDNAQAQTSRSCPEVLKMIQGTRVPYVKDMSVNERLRIAGRPRLSQRLGHAWHQNSLKGKANDPFACFGADVEKMLSCLNAISEH